MFMDPEMQLYMQDKQYKQDYLRDEIANKGYDQVEFAQYIDSKKRKHPEVGFITSCSEWNRHRQLDHPGADRCRTRVLARIRRRGCHAAKSRLL
jgi:hypothetical protein